MKWAEWMEKWSMTSLKLNLHFAELQFEPNDHDRNAAWDLYVELLTRITTQPLPEECGDEKVALESTHSLFPLTREILKRHGRHADEFAKLAIIVLNQVVRPFTAKWHKLSTELDRPARCVEFRRDLVALQLILARYTCMLGEMAGIEDDWTQLEKI
jgi:hypothetical protein